MTRHPADLLSLVAGLVLLALGLVLLTGGTGDLPMEWVGPAVAIGVGITILAAARQARAGDEDEPAASDEE